MKPKNFHLIQVYFLILIFISGFMQTSFGQISRGARDGEFYMTVSLFYTENNTIHWGLFHSNDHGKHPRRSTGELYLENNFNIYSSLDYGHTFT
jgi:hypothetical protein